MKIKINQIRTYDEAGFRRRAACLCFKSDCETEVLLVTSSRYRHRYVVPGGGLEPGEDPIVTAVREVKEEAGVIGKLGRQLDVFENKERKTRTYVYTMVVESLNDEYEDLKDIGRLRKWFTLEEAIQGLSYKPVQQAYLQKLFQEQIHQAKMAIHCNQLCHHFADDDQCRVPMNNACEKSSDETNKASVRQSPKEAARTATAPLSLRISNCVASNVWNEQSRSICSSEPEHGAKAVINSS